MFGLELRVRVTDETEECEGVWRVSRVRQLIVGWKHRFALTWHHMQQYNTPLSKINLGNEAFAFWWPSLLCLTLYRFDDRLGQNMESVWHFGHHVSTQRSLSLKWMAKFEPISKIRSKSKWKPLLEPQTWGLSWRRSAHKRSAVRLTRNQTLWDCCYRRQTTIIITIIKIVWKMIWGLALHLT